VREGMLGTTVTTTSVLLSPTKPPSEDRPRRAASTKPRQGNRRELNATKHGILSRHAVFWEDRAEFDALLASLVSDRMPWGAAEYHLVEEMAVIIWRKQRVVLAETASHRAGLQRGLEWDHQRLVRQALPHLRMGISRVDDPKAAVAASPGGSEVELEQLIADQAGTKEAVEILKAGKPKA
jgi:hypothetical protein